MAGEPSHYEAVLSLQIIADRIERASDRNTLPYFIRDNRERVERIMNPGEEEEETDRRIIETIEQILQPRSQKTYIAFEPFSPILQEHLGKLRDKKEKLRLFDELLNDDSFSQINVSENGYKTTLHPGHKIKDAYWDKTKQMASALNEYGTDVIFLPEYHSDTSADALIIINGMPRIVDFKYSSTTKYNTLQAHLVEGFQQAGAVVLKLENMDAGQFRETIEYIKRNNLPLGDILLINQYDKIKELSRRDLLEGKYINKIRGFLK